MPISELRSLSIAEAKGVEALHARHLGSRYRPGSGRSVGAGAGAADPGGCSSAGGHRRPAAPRTVSPALLLGVPSRPDARAALRGAGRRRAGEERRPVAGRCASSAGPSSPFAHGAARRRWPATRLGRTGAGGARGLHRVRRPTAGCGSRTGGGSGSARGAARPAGPTPAAAAPARRRRARRRPSPPPRPAAPPQQPRRPGARRAAAPAEAADAVRRPPTPPRRPSRRSRRRAAAAPTSGRRPPAVEARRLEQHFVYNSLNAIASLIRTDPARARELLLGFADLSRATDRPADTPSTLGHELAVVRDTWRWSRPGSASACGSRSTSTGRSRPSPWNPGTCSPPCATPCSATSNPALKGWALGESRAPAPGAGRVYAVTGGAGEPAGARLDHPRHRRTPGTTTVDSAGWSAG